MNRTSIPLKKVQIPPIGCHHILTVVFDGVACNLVLDTGASRSVIDKEHLLSILPELAYEHQTELSAGVGSSSLETSTTVIKKIKIGNSTLKDFELAVMDLTHVKNSYLQINEEAIHGVLGGEILEHLNATISYKAQKLTIDLIDD